MITDDEIGRVIGQLALNYNRGIDDEDAAIGLIDIWRTAIGGCAPVDVDAALRATVADPEVRFFPPVADFRQRVIAAAQARHRAAADNSDGRGTVACLRCLDSGWLDAGTDDDGYWYVRPCPEGCVPPVAHRAHHRTHRRGRKDGAQLSLVSSEALAEAVEGTHRMLGDRDHGDF